MCRYLSIVLISLYLLSPFIAHSQGMSELDIRGFEKKEDRKQQSSVKSPFTPTRSSPKDLMVEDLFLTGIAIGPGRSYALISGHILHEGDSVADMRVRSIGKDKVVLQHLDKVHILHLEGGL